jgi:N-acetyl-gamma-glutamyl-phosphate reductase
VEINLGRLYRRLALPAGVKKFFNTFQETPMLRVAVIGGTGYTGGELLRLLCRHPNVTITAVTSGQSAGGSIDEKLPHLKGFLSLPLEPLDLGALAGRADFFFLALPHRSAQTPMASLIGLGKKVVDLSADFRLRDPAVYQKWYQAPHSQPDLLKRVAYGLSEVYREAISAAQGVANPGCYPTAALLLLYPLIKAGMIDPSGPIVIDSKSGVSGAGRAPSQSTHFPEVNEGTEAYSVGIHRHLPEILQEIDRMGMRSQKVIFTPHLLPINRGILTTIYLRPARAITRGELLDLIASRYKGHPFIRIVEGSPNPRNVRGSNLCDIGAYIDADSGWAVLFSAIDNLVKGAAGQAIQNMNLMMGYEETAGLLAPGVFP